MKILLIEDEDRGARQALELFERAAPSSSVQIATSRDDALDAMDGEGFDLIVCDLRIPPSNSSADVDERHGLAVHAAARDSCPGTPIVFLTAFATKRNTRTQLSSGGTKQIYGLKDYPMVQLVEKGDMDEFEDLVSTLAQALKTVESSSELLAGDASDEMFLRAVKTYAHQINMSNAVIHTIAGGLSGAPLGRVELSSPQGGKANIFMKVVAFQDAVNERTNFEEFVPNRLQTGFFAPALSPITAGLRGQAALLSSLADGCVSLFHLLTQNPAVAAEAVKALKEATRPWIHASEPALMSLADLRRRRITDEKLAEALTFSGRALVCNESRTVEMKTSVCHGDLHGENILVTAEGRPILIDFGDLGLNVAPLDPVTLELSIIFHKAGPARSTDWFANAKWESWADLDIFVEGSPFELFIRECRAWSMEQDCANAVFASAYAHAMRQFKYPDVDKGITQAIAQSAYAAMSTSAPL
ncbi:phosphotransferase [Pseudarthrobacter sp. SSS035]|uniref:phosphotransferase n=1 Tax=Pseudarthrobacter sp. SSS035 TaxID=2931399 RepID=UPI002010A6F6|nr:phosphotransferase [Pseudarthrobacter sp. SSS035]